MPKVEPITYDYDEEDAVRDEMFSQADAWNRHSAIALQNGQAAKAAILAEVGKRISQLHKKHEAEKHGTKLDYLLSSADRKAGKTDKVK